MINEITFTLLIVLHSVSVRTPTLQDPKIIKMRVDLLDKAVEKGELEKVQELLQKNKYTNDEKSQILENAALHRRFEIMKVLLESKAKPTSGAVNYAIAFGTLKDFKILIQWGASIHENDIFGTTLHAAACYGKFEMVKYLVDYGVKQIPNQDLDTPLHKLLYHLCTSNETQVKRDNPLWTKIAKFLIANGADIKSQNNRKYTPLHYASRLGHFEIAESLIEKGADLNVKSFIGATPLHVAAYFGFKDVTELLLKNGAKINETNDKGCTPLNLSLSSKNKEIAKLLIINGAQVNIKVQVTNAIVTPLHLAILHCWQDGLELLLKYGANINGTDEYKNSPLHYAVESKNTKAVESLLKNGADLNIKNVNNQIALDVAKENESRQFVELLVNKMIKNKDAENGINPPKAKRFKLDDCVICCTARDEIFVFNPCGHAKTCENCTLKIVYKSDISSNCPVCRQKVETYVKAFV